jgi:hypothetical protein
MTQLNAVIQQADAEKLLDEMVKGMDSILEKMKPELDKVEADLLKGMVTFGASQYDVEKVRVWLRPMMEQEVKRRIFEEVTKTL